MRSTTSLFWQIQWLECFASRTVARPQTTWRWCRWWSNLQILLCFVTLLCSWITNPETKGIMMFNNPNIGLILPGTLNSHHAVPKWPIMLWEKAGGERPELFLGEEVQVGVEIRSTSIRKMLKRRTGGSPKISKKIGWSFRNCRQIIATKPPVGSYQMVVTVRESPPNALNSGLGIMVIYPEGCFFQDFFTSDDQLLCR